MCAAYAIGLICLDVFSISLKFKILENSGILKHLWNVSRNSIYSEFAFLAMSMIYLFTLQCSRNFIIDLV